MSYDGLLFLAWAWFAVIVILGCARGTRKKPPRSGGGQGPY